MEVRQDEEPEVVRITVGKQELQFTWLQRLDLFGLDDVAHCLQREKAFPVRIFFVKYATQRTLEAH